MKQKVTRNERREVREVKHFGPAPRSKEPVPSQRIEHSPEWLKEIERQIAAGEIPF